MCPGNGLGRRMRKAFPILHNCHYKGEDEAIPWEVIEPHENQAYENHGQSLEQLEKRGGLSWREMYAVVSDMKFDYQNKDKFSEASYKLAVLDILRKFYLEH